MAGRRKHAARSRATHARGLMWAKRFLTPAMPKWLRILYGMR